MDKPAVLVLGGLDPQGCAGISADIKTLEAHGCHPLPVVTALTVQSSAGLQAFGAVDTSTFMAQVNNCMADFDIRAIKVGLIPTVEIAQCIKEVLLSLKLPVVLDPVLGSTTGGVQVDEDVILFIRKHLFPLVTLATPNIPELFQLTSQHDNNEQRASSLIREGLKNCLVKGGHADGVLAIDYFFSANTSFYVYQPKSINQVRGTGCVLASAITAHLAMNEDIRDAIVLAKAYISRGIRQAEKVGPYQLIHHSLAPFTLEDIPKLSYQKNGAHQQLSFPSCPKRLGIYPVVDSADWVKKLTEEGVKTIQLRIKTESTEVKRAAIKAAIAHVQNKAVRFFVNDHWKIAIEQGAYGVHLGQEDLHDANLNAIANAGLRLGVSTHSYWELARALAVNPSYIALGPIYETTSKQMPFSPQGEERLRQWVDLLADDNPLVAIGGVNLTRAKALKKTGVGSVAMITAITEAADYREATRAFIDGWQ